MLRKVFLGGEQGGFGVVCCGWGGFFVLLI